MTLPHPPLLLVTDRHQARRPLRDVVGSALAGGRRWLSLREMREMVAAARVPVLPIGGINAARVGEVIASGCAGIAVMGGVMRAADPAGEVRALVASLRGALVTRGSAAG